MQRTFPSQEYKTRLLDTLCEVRNLYVMQYVRQPKPIDYNDRLAAMDQDLRDVQNTPVAQEQSNG